MNYNNVSASEEDDNGLKKVCMASHRIGELGLSESGPSSHHIPYGVLNGINTPVSSLINQGSAFDFGELEEAIVLHGVKGRNDDSKACMFPFSSLVLFFF